MKMLEEEMKVGPKGQVVIPRTLRKALKIQVQSEIQTSKMENSPRKTIF
jgi:bifunctional DNA-binding transcriptional regulator/antitoxin component of YhaV-PrlF toxin-antitoxin module